MVDDSTGRRLNPPFNVILDAVRASKLSPCRSKRGAVVFRGDTVFTSGCNHQVPPLTCDGSDACKATCRQTAVHAEQVALNGTGAHVRGCDLLHVKTVDGQLVPSGPPSCVQCSKLAALSGIAGVWLYHAEGWKRYHVNEFHELSARASLTDAQATIARLEARIQDAAFNCPSCGRHDFGLFASPIAALRKAEAQLTALRAEYETLKAQCRYHPGRCPQCGEDHSAALASKETP